MQPAGRQNRSREKRAFSPLITFAVIAFPGYTRTPITIQAVPAGELLQRGKMGNESLGGQIGLPEFCHCDFGVGSSKHHGRTCFTQSSNSICFDGESMLEYYHQKIVEQLNTLIRDVNRPNILTLGMTGAGKSSLINHVFGGVLAATGTGKPVTQGITFYDSPSRGIGVFDSRGYEVGTKGEELYYRETVGFATDASGDISRGVHLAWYCIPAESERIHPIDEQTIAEFCRIGIPTAAVITKTDHLSYVKLARFVRRVSEKIGVQVPSFKTSIVGGSDDIQNLCAWSTASLPESLRLAFTRSQRQFLASKREQANAIVRAAKADASIEGFALFDSTDEQALNEKVFGMAARILYLYEMEEIRHSLQGVSNLLDDGQRMVAFVASLIERASEIIGYFIAESQGRQLGRFVGKMLANLSRSITSQHLIEAIGLSIVSICSELADHAIATPEAATPLGAAQIDQRFITEVRKHLES